MLYNSQNLPSVICLYIVYYIWPIDRTLSGAISPRQSGPGSNGNGGLLHILHISKARTSPSDCLVLYQDARLGGGWSYPSAEM